MAKPKKLTTLTGKPLKHGTYYAYDSAGCRCDPCRKANAEKARQYKRRIREHNARGLREKNGDR